MDTVTLPRQSRSFPLPQADLEEHREAGIGRHQVAQPARGQVAQSCRQPVHAQIGVRIDALAEALPKWANLAPNARFVLTSRARLGLTGAAEVEVDGLHAPAAVDLLVDRARLQRADWSPNAQELAELGELVGEVRLLAFQQPRQVVAAEHGFGIRLERGEVAVGARAVEAAPAHARARVVLRLGLLLDDERAHAAVVRFDRDARAGRPAYFWAMAFDAAHRSEMRAQGWKDVGKVFVAAIVLDLGYQIVVLRFFYPVQALIVAFVLAVLPYLVLRAAVGRLAGSRRAGRNPT